MTDLDHVATLRDEARKMIDEDAAARIRWFRGQELWIPYAGATSVITTVADLVDRPRVARMRGALVQAESNNGKSRLARECLARHPLRDDPNKDHVSIPLILFEMPPAPDEDALITGLLKILKQPMRSRGDRPAEKRDQLVTVLREVELRALLVDEIQRLLGARQNVRRVIMDSLRYIASQVPVPLVLFSTPRGSNALASSDEMINRLHTITLPVWKLDTEFRQLLAAFETLLPLKSRSRLTAKSTVALLHSKCEGLIGEVRDLLELCLVAALGSSSEQITDELIQKVPWVPPSGRKRAVGAPGRQG